MSNIMSERVDTFSTNGTNFVWAWL